MVKKSKFYSILADEPSDGILFKEFLQFFLCKEGLSGKDLASVVLKCLNEDL